MESNNSTQGFFEIGIANPAHDENIGTLWRSAYQLGTSGIFTIGKAQAKPASDTSHSWQKIPYRRFQDFDQLKQALPFSTQLVAIEMNGTPLAQFVHPLRCVYLLGSEHNGLSPTILSQCHAVVSLESVRSASYNVAVAGSILMYHRYLQYPGHTETDL
jgi:tRNA G18 (ribose-2'-O)-methylase SpoU